MSDQPAEPLAPETAEQLKILTSGVDRVAPEHEFVRKLDRAIKTGTGLRVKLGIDPSTPDIHIGHGVPLRLMRRFQQLGHTAVLIIGDFTGQVGDPTGRSETRRALAADEVVANGRTYEAQARKILLPDRLEILRNSEWLGALGTAGLLQLASRMTVARMLERDDFSNRYKSGQPISIVEFLYPLLQGHDSVVVRADVELGGTDQLFNLLVGRDLQVRDGQEPQVAFTVPLLEGLDGEMKMSKSYGNYVGITDEPADMYGKLMSVPDRLLGKYLRLTTDLHPDAIEQIESRAAGGGKAAADAKRRLAHEVTAIYHGTDAADAAAAHFDRIHVERAIPGDIPEHDIPAESIQDGAVPLARLITALGFATGTSDARRKIEGRGVRVGGEVVEDPKATFDPAALAGKVIQVGKRSFAKIRG
ncbi:MAG TPA: tyrosine--tRNA ligase [Actinomycetota bacterium]|nr:tyrosine--tRNA ligase [Actinomycetota bacterium]